MDKLKLEYEMKKKGLTTAELCEKIGISVSTFYRKCNGKSEFKLREIKAIAEALNLETPNSIFFAEQVS